MPRKSDLSRPPRRIPAAELARMRSHPFRYRPQHAVIVVCDGEAHHRAVFARLRKLGFEKLRAVSV